MFAARTTTFNDARNNIFAPVGTAPTTMTRDAIEAAPQGANKPVDKVLLQLPGVSQDSAASGNLHVRNEHANVSYRINGILLPDGLGGFGQFLDTTFIGRLSLLTGALPAQFGLRTAGIVDIETSSGTFDNTGRVSIYGGSRETINTSVQYGGRTGNTEYFFTGRYLQNILGIENPTASLNAIHDFTRQDRGFAYISTIIDPTTRVSFIGGTATNRFQIPNIPGVTPNFTAFGNANFDSTMVNQNQVERYTFGVLALQKSINNVDLQLSYFTRSSSVQYTPDPLGDLMFNGVATDVSRKSLVNGIQGDAAIRINDAHTLRTGMFVSAEKTQVTNSSQLLPIDGVTGNQILPDTPFGVTDSSSLLGWLAGVYISDEWKITDRLTLNYGGRFDQMWQYQNANQFSPRVSMTYKADAATTFHAGYARTFTPPVQVIAAPTNTALFTSCPPAIGNPNCTTVQAPSVAPPYNPMLPERAHVFDVGVVQKVLPGLELGADVYYKVARDLIDDGQFGAALVLNGFNYERAQNTGVELKALYNNGNFRAYANWAWANQRGNNIVTNQYLFDPVRLAFAQTNWIYTDHSQVWTGSGGMSYLWNGTRFSTDVIYGSGLRAGFANTDHNPAYAQVNVGLSREFKFPDWSPVTLRFDVVNVFDTSYIIRDGTGIGVFAPQFGPRRGFYVGLSQKFGPGTTADKPAEPPAYASLVKPVFKAAALDDTFGPSKPWTWSGYYIGVNAGYGWGNSRTGGLFSDDTLGGDLFATTASSNLTGFVGGAQTGYIWQFGNWLAGIEADVQLTSQKGSPTFLCPDVTCNPNGPVTASLDQKLEWFGTLRGRFGTVVMPDAMVYLTGGLAVAGFQTVGTVLGFDVNGAPGANPFSQVSTRTGWTVGAGIEGHLVGRWTGKVEYLYMDFGTLSAAASNQQNITLTNVFNSRITDSVVRVGVNYKFSSNGAITTRY